MLPVVFWWMIYVMRMANNKFIFVRYNGLINVFLRLICCWLSAKTKKRCTVDMRARVLNESRPQWSGDITICLHHLHFAEKSSSFQVYIIIFLLSISHSHTRLKLCFGFCAKSKPAPVYNTSHHHRPFDYTLQIHSRRWWDDWWFNNI